MGLVLCIDFRIRLCDFGLSHQFPEGQWFHDEGRGTAPYAAPETALGQVCLKSDIWSFGLLMYEFLTDGERPSLGPTSNGDSEATALTAYRRHPSFLTSLPVLSSGEAAIDPTLWDTIFQAEPERRCSIDAVRDAVLASLSRLFQHPQGLPFSQRISFFAIGLILFSVIRFRRKRKHYVSTTCRGLGGLDAFETEPMDQECSANRCSESVLDRDDSSTKYYFEQLVRLSRYYGRQ